MDLSDGGICIVFILWLGANAADGFWTYYYVQTSVYPVPHNAIDRTHGGYIAFEIMMYIYGLCIACVNAVLAGLYVVYSMNIGCLGMFFNLLLAYPICLLIFTTPLFGGWAVTRIVRKHVWAHGCDSYPLYAILDGKVGKSPANVVYFFEQGSTDALYTYELSNPGNGDIWILGLREFDTEQSDIPLNLYPTLQLVQYDFANEAVTATCTTPAAENSTTSTGCLTGTFNSGSPLYLNLTSSVPLNNTSNATAVPKTTTILRSQDAAWSYRDQNSSLILRELDGDTLGRSVLQTTVTKVTDCTELKVCVAGTGAPSLVGAEVMASLGLILMKQANYASFCTHDTEDEVPFP